MELGLWNSAGERIGSVRVSDAVFGVPMNGALVHQVVVGQRANARQGTASTKTRAEVSGGGAKPRPQKHSGRARQGSIRSPQWKGGGVVFGPRPRSYRHRTPKKVRRQALLVALSEKARTEELVVLQELKLDEAKTKEMVRMLGSLEAKPPILMVADGAESSVIRCARNIPRVKMLPAALLNPADVLGHRNLIMTVDAVRKAEELWGGPFVRRKAAVEAGASEG